jgi:hypothetical protein
MPFNNPVVEIREEQDIVLLSFNMKNAVRTGYLSGKAEPPCTSTMIFMPQRMLVNLVLSIDTFNDPTWHLSMSEPNFGAMLLGRVSDELVSRITQAFFGTSEVVENLSPTGNKIVRHFETRYFD